MTLLTVTEVTKQFAGIRALDRVSLDVAEGECVGLIGPNGAGKTTLFDCLTGRQTPESGRVTFRGRSLAGLPGHRRAQLGLARTFQRVEMFPGMSVRDHLLVALRARSDHGGVARDALGWGRPTRKEVGRADTVLQALGLVDEADRPIEALTLGRARLVELGRALVGDPVLLFLDEPSSGLDRSEAGAVAGVLEELRARTSLSILVVEHDVPLVRRLASRLYVLDAGRLVASGPTEEVLAHPDVRSAYLGAGV